MEAFLSILCEDTEIAELELQMGSFQMKVSCLSRAVWSLGMTELTSKRCSRLPRLTFHELCHVHEWI